MIVVGYSADRFGAAAVEHGIAEAKLRDSSLLVINATEGESYVDRRFAGSGQIVDLETHLADSGPLSGSASRWGWIRHRSPVGKLLLGSVSQKLMLECREPVLAVEPPED